MSFRELFLRRLTEKVPVSKEVDPAKLQPFSRKDIETGIQLYIHLKALGYTFEDLRNWVEKQRDQERRGRSQSAIREAIHQTRAQKKLLRGGPTKGRIRRAKHGT